MILGKRNGTLVVPAPVPTQEGIRRSNKDPWPLEGQLLNIQPPPSLNLPYNILRVGRKQVPTGVGDS